MRFIPVLLVAALLPVLAGCGSGSDVGAAADVVPADVFVYASVDTDFDGDGWAALEEFAAKFPGGDNLLQSLADDQLGSEEGIDFEADVKPALGDEVAVVVLDAPAEDPLAESTSESFVLLLQPEDDAAFQRLLEKSDEPPVTDEVDGWTVVAEDQESLDSFRAALDGPRLDGSEDFERAMEDLDDGALARVFVNGAKLSEAYEAESSEKPPVDALLPGGELPSFGMAFDVESDSARIDGRAVFADENPFATDSYSADLPEKVPGDVLAYVSFNDLESAFSRFRDVAAETNPEAEHQLGMAEALLGVSLEEDVFPLLSGEGALYLRAGAPIPEVTLVTEIEDEDERPRHARQDRAVRRRLRAAAAEPEDRRDRRRRGPRAPDCSAGVALLRRLRRATRRHELAGGHRRAAPGQRPALRQRGVRRRARPRGRTRRDAGLRLPRPREHRPARPGFQAVAAERRSSRGARPIFDPLQSLVFYGDQDDDTASFTLFLGVE